MNRSPKELSGTALTLFEEARASGEYEVAYHALAAALHAAESMEDATECTRVERLAAECLTFIDANDPGHKLSSSTAQSRGRESIYRQLALTAVSARLRIDSEALQRKNKGRPEAPFSSTS